MMKRLIKQNHHRHALFKFDSNQPLFPLQAQERRKIIVPKENEN